MMRSSVKEAMMVFLLQLVVTMVAAMRIEAFTSIRKPLRSVKVLSASQSSDQDGKESFAEGLVAAGSSLQSQLASAFSNLDESDQYDAVLTGLCAKILDEPTMSGDEVIVALEDPINLLEEMNTRRVSAGSRSLMALVDVSSTIFSVPCVSRNASRLCQSTECFSFSSTVSNI